jgi:SAM-dependent methyltransferase
VPFRARFDCLWCGAAWETRASGDLEGWAQLCPTCLGKAGTNEFLRARLRAALGERSAATVPVSTGEGSQPPGRAQAGGRHGGGGHAGGARAGGARARQPWPALPDDWFLGTGAFARPAIDEAVWTAELDIVTRWLDAQPLAGRIAEPAAGVGFFSPLLAGKGELHAGDPDGPALDRARDRLLAHGLRAHLHEADPWSRPSGEPPVDAVVAAFLLGRVRGAGLDAGARALRERLRPGGRLSVIDLRPDPSGGAPAGLPWTYHDPAIVEAALLRAGFTDVVLEETGRFFLLAGARAG